MYREDNVKMVFYFLFILVGPPANESGASGC